jgi:hypothetical protein
MACNGCGTQIRRAWWYLAVVFVLGMSGCGGSSNSGSPSMPPPVPPSSPPPTPSLDPSYRVSGASPFAANCDNGTTGGTAFVNAEVEPSFAVNPTNSQNLAAVWQEDRWSTGGSRGLVAGRSIDGGETWAQQALAFTRCGGGTGANGGDYERGSNPWMTVSSNGVFEQVAITFTGSVLAPGSVSAVLASRSLDGGATWQPTQTLIRDTNVFFNDKPAITADPVSVADVYAVWDRLSSLNTGPTYFTRSLDRGATWETPRSIYDPGQNNQTISNVIVVLPNGVVIDLFVNIVSTSPTAFTSSFDIIRSMDNGANWSAPIVVAENLSVGTADPQTGTRVRDSSLIPEIAVAPNGDMWVTWQDARFNGGAHDGVVVSHSGDGGLTWSSPAQINTVPSVPAFSPKVLVLPSGKVGVSYYDFRSNTSDAATLFTNYWLTYSDDGVTWREHPVAGPFDLDFAPLTTSPAPGGYFLGDYQAMQSSANTFLPMFVQTNADSGNRTDIVLAPAVSATSAASAKAAAFSVAPPTTPEFRRKVNDNIVRVMRARFPDWPGKRRDD